MLASLAPPHFRRRIREALSRDPEPGVPAGDPRCKRSAAVIAEALAIAEGSGHPDAFALLAELGLEDMDSECRGRVLARCSSTVNVSRGLLQVSKGACDSGCFHLSNFVSSTNL